MNLPLITPARGNDGDYSVMAQYRESVGIADSVFETQALSNAVVEAARDVVSITKRDGVLVTAELLALEAALSVLDAFHQKRVKILLGYEK